jgi:M6 family metalloprotease-like protein
MPLDPEIVERYIQAGRPLPVEMTERSFMKRFAVDRANQVVPINRLPREAVTRLAPRSEIGGGALLRPGDKSFEAAEPGARNAAQASQILKAIVILVKFQDDPPGGPAVRFSPGVWDSMLFGDVYVRGGADTTTGRTLSRFLREISYGDVDIQTYNMPSTVGWVTAPNDYSYYCAADDIHNNGFGPYPQNVQRLVMDAVLAADPYVDFSQYAVDGIVQNLFVVHAGSGAEWSGGSALIWSHSWAVGVPDGWGNEPPPLIVDGVYVFGYSMEPEAGGDVLGEAGPPMMPLLPTVGVYAHEFGHVLGLPDEYDYGYESQGTGRVSLMAAGSWNRCPNVYPDCAGNSPAHLSALGTAFLGFVTPIEVTSTKTGITMPPIEITPSGTMYKVGYPGTDGKEYWLVENRQQTGFDEGFVTMTSKAHGLCVYHVDENVFERIGWLPNEAECVSHEVYVGYPRNCDCDTLQPNMNNGEKWYGIAVEQADGLYQLELGLSAGYWQDFYSRETGVESFNATSRPNSSSYYTQYDCAGIPAVLNIAEIGRNITLDIVPRPVAKAALEPRVLNLKNEGTWIGLALGFEAPYEARDIDPSSVTLAGVAADPKFSEMGRNASASASGSENAMFKFDRDRIMDAIWRDIAGRAGQQVSPAGALAQTRALAQVRGLAQAGAPHEVIQDLTSESGAEVELALDGIVDGTPFEGAVSLKAIDNSAGPRIISPGVVSGSATASPTAGSAPFEIVWWLPRAGGARLQVVSQTGELVAMLIDGFQQAGIHRTVWDGADKAGTKVSRGTYFVRLESKGGTEQRPFAW